ncbi:hypothetical protein, partial [Mycobacterium sp.]|uniref:hypothetical protein n=1 Tax=Mycobacterium sp. TaxID=1785 RepID=UPI003F7D7E75
MRPNSCSRDGCGSASRSDSRRACSLASLAERADAAHADQAPAERNGEAQPSSATRTMRTPGAVNQRATSAVSST